MKLSLRQLEVFSAIMRTGTMTAASKMLAISQPAASRLLRHAEEQLGAALFERRKGRLHPTVAAQVLFPEVDRIFGDLDYVQKIAGDLRNLRPDRLHIAAISSLTGTLVARAAGPFIAANPGVNLSTSNLLNFQVPELVRDGRVDFGLAFRPVGEFDLHVEEILRTRIVAVLPRDHRLCKRECLSVNDLATCRIISFSSSLPIGQGIEDAFRARDIEQPISVEVTHSFVACAFVLAGCGVALVDGLALAGGAYPQLTSRPVEPLLEISAVLLTPAKQRLSRIAGAFAREVQLAAAELMANDFG